LKKDEHAAEWLASAEKKCRDWGKKWKLAIRDDECSVEKSNDPRPIWVFGTPYEKWTKDSISPCQKGPDAKLMGWVCWWGP
jgi:hypothetical protein